MKPWSLSVGPGFGMKRWYQFSLERALSHQVLESISWGTTRSLHPLTSQKILALPSLTGTTRCSPGRCFMLPWVGVHSMHRYPEEKPTIFPISLFYPLLQICQSPPSPKRFLSREEEIPVSPNCSAAGAPLTCCLFPKPFPAHRWASSWARVSAAYPTRRAMRWWTKQFAAQQLSDQLHITQERIYLSHDWNRCSATFKTRWFVHTASKAFASLQLPKQSLNDVNTSHSANQAKHPNSQAVPASFSIWIASLVLEWSDLLVLEIKTCCTANSFS